MKYNSISFPYREAPEEELPAEGLPIIATDGEDYALAYFIWSGDYEFRLWAVDEQEDEFPFQPTQWTYFDLFGDVSTTIDIGTLRTAILNLSPIKHDRRVFYQLVDKLVHEK